MVREVVVPEVFRHSKDESWNRLLQQSEAERWMKRTQPRWFCVSSKQSKPMAELQKGRVQCWNTAEHGAISFHFRGEQAIVTTWLKP